jgi:hypothetical protein
MNDPMIEDSLDYPRFIQQALREGVVRRSLEIVAREGLSGAHSLYITVRTDHPGVELAGNLFDTHPEQLTFVIEHQFRDLEVTADWFAVTLWFGGIPHALKIPFEAMLGFSDPSVNLQLVFPPIDDDATAEEMLADQVGEVADDEQQVEEAGGNVVSFAAFRNKVK